MTIQPGRANKNREPRLSKDRRLEERQVAFVAAARRLFIEKGFDDTSLADVVSEAGGSLATLYKLFGNKAGLLAAAVSDRARSGAEMITRIGAQEDDPIVALTRLGREMRCKFFDEEGVAIIRVVIAYSIKDPRFASEFARQTMTRAQEALAQLFTNWRSRGIHLAGEPGALAAAFLGMFVHELHSDAISHGALAPSEFRDLDTKIEFFCRGAGLIR